MDCKHCIPNKYVNYNFFKNGIKQSNSILKMKVYEKRQRIICNCLP